ncbi:hypothetical protein K438DRAFT_1812548 [Mycena galopus ATCC 62051]|nr:hypothetical protein K438DRAFT_1812548 [Mycena galopus ATCC 62051]
MPRPSFELSSFLPLLSLFPCFVPFGAFHAFLFQLLRAYPPLGFHFSDSLTSRLRVKHGVRELFIRRFTAEGTRWRRRPHMFGLSVGARAGSGCKNGTCFPGIVDFSRLYA